MKMVGLAAAALIASSLAANAATIQFSDSIGLQSTNFSDTVNIQQFDSALGTLTAVTVELVGTAQGNASAESLDASPTTVTLSLTATLTASLAGFGTLAEAVPLVQETVNFTAFDGTIDFAGTSGAEFIDQSATASDTQTYTDAATLAAFTGTSLLSLDVAGIANSFGTGSGNLLTLLVTNAGADVTVTYTFDEAPIVPLPAALPMFLAALGGLGFMRRRRGA